VAIFCECLKCHRRQSVKYKVCECGANLDEGKKNGFVRYWIDYYQPNGKRRREAVGFSLKDAQAAIEKKRTRDILDESSMTFDDLSGWYLKLDSVKALASFSIIGVYLRKFNAVFGSTVVGKILPEDLKSLVVKRRKQGSADATIDQELGKVRAMIQKAFENHKVSSETVQTFKTIKKQDIGNASARTRILSPEEFQALVQAAAPHLRPIIMAAYYTGMREGEILNLVWSKVDLKNNLIHLGAADTKDREARTVPIAEPLHAALKVLPRAIHDQHVFLYRGKPITDIRTGLRAACEGAGIEYGRFKKGGFIFHDLRHTFNTNMRKAGVPESVIMKITGHSTRAMFDRYNTVDEADLWQAVQKMNLVLGV